MYIQGRGLTSMNYRPCNYSEVCAYLDFFLLLVSTTLKSIFGPLSHVEWERLILSIWQASLKSVWDPREGKICGVLGVNEQKKKI